MLDDAHNPFMQMRNHVLAGIELDQKQQPRAALKEFEAGMRICERMELLDHYADRGKHWIYVITLPMYVLPAGIYNELGETEEAIRCLRGSMGWLEYCDSIELRERYAYEGCLIMMGNRRLDMAQRLVARTYRDADVLKKHDDALMCAAFMLEIEDMKYATSPKDNPWIERGKQHYGGATQPEVKSIFLSLLRKAYLKGGMHDEARRLEHLVRQARKSGVNPFLADANVTPYDTALLDYNMKPGDSLRLSPPHPTGAEAADSSSIVPQTIGKIEYIYRHHYGLIIATGVLLAIVIIVFIVYAVRQRLIRQRSQQEAEQEQNRRFLEGMENERTRLAKELHDGVSNQLLAIEMKLDEARSAPEHQRERNNDNGNGKWEQARRMLTESREQVRRVSHELMPPEFSYAHLGEVIENFIDEMDGTNGIAIHFDSQAGEECYKSIPPVHALEIYRLVQEAVTNAVKHAAPSDVYVLLRDEGGSILVRITDNGTMPTDACTANTHGIGLHTMNQRAKAIGATLTAEKMRYGTVVTLQYPKKS